MHEFIIEEGQGIIDILYYDFASCLVVKRGLAANWPDCQGTVGEYYAISDYSTEERNFYTKGINQVLTEGTDEEQIKAISNFLNLFTNGKYLIDKKISKFSEQVFCKENQTIYPENTPEEERFFGGFYELFHPFSYKIFSITNDKINASRVEYYIDLINKSLTPTILVFQVCDLLTSEYSHYYVLDGHHKIEAYQRLKKDIPFISICKLEESKNKISKLLHCVKPFLKPFEFNHFFITSDESLLEIDFVNDEILTSVVDDRLMNSEAIGRSIINVLRKYAKSENQVDQNWFHERIPFLKSNTHLTDGNLKKELSVWEKYHHKKHCQYWGNKKINDLNQLNNWIDKTIIRGESKHIK